MKRCSKCGEEKPLEMFSKGNGKDGLQTHCKACVSAYNHANKAAILVQKREYRATLASRETVPTPDKKQCTMCKSIKLATEFYLDRGTLDGLNSNCKTCRRAHEIATKDQIANRRRALGSKRRSRDLIEIPTERHCPRCKITKLHKEFCTDRRALCGLTVYCKSCLAKYRESRRDEINEYSRKRRWENPGLYRETMKAWRKEHPDKVTASGHRYKALKHGNGGNLTGKEIADLRIKQAGICAYCKRGAKLTIDHVIPVTQGGLNDISNIVLCCRRCNSSKNNKTPEQWKHRWYLR